MMNRSRRLIVFRLWIKSLRSLIALIKPMMDLSIRLMLGSNLLASALAYREVGGLLFPTILLCAAVAIIAGFMTRLIAAIAVIALIALLASVAPSDTRLFQIALFSWLAIHGAGTYSLDALFRAGLAISAVTPMGVAVSAADWLTRHAEPVLLLVYRAWLAATWFVIALSPGRSQQWEAVLPVNTFAIVLPGPALLAGVLAFAGAAMPLQLAILVLSILGYQAVNLTQGLEITGIDPLSVLVCALVALFGSGMAAIDRKAERWLQSHVLYERSDVAIPAEWPHVVIVGAGFGGLAAAMRLARLPVRVTLIDRQNYHLFQPLLYQIATASLSPSDIALSIRSLFRKDRNVSVLLGEVTAVDPAARQVALGEKQMRYDRLIIATGAQHSYFGHDDWSAYAPGLKRVEDGVHIRARVLKAFEHAEAESDPGERARLMTFVVVGGGPTGVELAGAISEMACLSLVGEFRAIDPRETRVVLLHAGDRLLPSFPQELSNQAHSALTSLGVEVRLNALVTDIGPKHVALGDERLASGTVIWAAGVIASPAAAWLGAECDRAGRVIVGPDLSVPGHPDIFAIGDTAASTAWSGAVVPGLAPAAKQAGEYVAQVIQAQLSGAGTVQPFSYRHRGSLATIGRKHAVAQIGRLLLAGAPAWWVWGAVHIGFLAGGRNRSAVLLNWVWSYVTLRSNITLITENKSSSTDLRAKQVTPG